MGNDVPSGKNQYRRSTHEYKGIQTEYKNPRELTSRAVQTGYKEYKRGTNGIQKNTSEHKRSTNDEGHYIFGTTN